tara:strand:+ start:673 stop:918 length:246 start_codon:yes stop_codon:yes gene_type:complete
MWKNWVYKPVICLSSGVLAQSILGYIYEIKYYLTSGKIDRNYVDYRRVEINKIIAFWTGLGTSFLFMRYYNFDSPKLLKNE